MRLGREKGEGTIIHTGRIQAAIQEELILRSKALNRAFSCKDVFERYCYMYTLRAWKYLSTVSGNGVMSPPCPRVLSSPSPQLSLVPLPPFSPSDGLPPPPLVLPANFHRYPPATFPCRAAGLTRGFLGPCRACVPQCYVACKTGLCNCNPFSKAITPWKGRKLQLL